MKSKVLIPVIGIIVATVIACNSNSSSKAKIEEYRATEDKATRVMRGKYLVSVIGCGDCHTPKIMTPAGPVWDTTRALSGYNSEVPFGSYDTTLAQSGQWALFGGDLTSAAGPWGVSFAANLTPDPTGLGNWTVENFKTALKKGKYKGIESARDLLPPMPWPVYRNMTDEDMESIFEYLQTIKPVQNRVPSAIAPRA